MNCNFLKSEKSNIINIGNDEFLEKQLVQDDSIYKENIDSSCTIICTSGSISLPKLVYKQNKIIR